MKIYKYPLKVVAFFYGFVIYLKDIFSSPYSTYRLYLLYISLNEDILKITNEFDKVDRIKQAMIKVGYNNYSQYFRSSIVSKDAKSPKVRWSPIVYLPGIASEPFPAKTKFPWATDFEKNYQVILDEFLFLSQEEGIAPYHVPEAAGKIIIPNWSTFFFVDQFGVKRE